MDEEDLDRLLAAVEAELGREWVDTIEWLRGQNEIDDVEARIASGDVAGAVQGVEDAATRYAAAAADAYLVSGQRAAAWLDGLVDDALVTFDATNQRAVLWAQRNRLQLGGGVTTEQREVIRGAIAEGIGAGRNPREVARDIRDSLGLTEYQRSHVASYRRALEAGDFANALGRELRDGRSDKLLRRLAREDGQLTAAQVDRMVARYAENYVAYRAETIARTEALRAVHQGADEAFQQAIDLGQIEAGQLEFEWLAGSAPRTRDWHASMNGQKRPPGEAFVSGQGNRLMFPGDPSAPASETANCRCKRTARLKPDEAAAAA